MKLLIKQARVVDPSSPFNAHVTDIFIENGIITRIGKNSNEKADREISVENLHVSPGWVDLFANFADPGYEYKENLETGAAAAAAGGYTDVFVIPNTKPPVHDKAGVEYIRLKSRGLPVTVHPVGAVTKNTEGKELAEMYDMKTSGAIAFSDGIHGIQSAGLLVKALQYIKTFNGVLIQVPDDKSINPHGLMNEGIISTQLGLAGKPAMAEELMVSRDIKLAHYTESKLHLTGISTKKSLEYVNRARKKNIPVSCSVTPYHLFFSDEDLSAYDTNLKVNPPLRGKDDRLALQKAIMDGIVDCIASHHLPHESDSKVTEFEYAKYGMTGLETAFAVVRTALPSLDLDSLIRLFAINPRQLFHLEPVQIREGGTASLTLFDPDRQWTYQAKFSKSKSSNSPFDGSTLTGKVIGIVNRDNIITN